MQQIFTPRIVLLGVLTWLVPFAASFLSFGPGGVPWIPYTLFKSIMVVVFGGFGLWMLLLALPGRSATVMGGLAVGLLWLAINLALDLVVLLPMTGMPLVSYLFDIGLRYLLIPLMGVALGMQAERAREA